MSLKNKASENYTVISDMCKSEVLNAEFFFISLLFIRVGYVMLSFPKFIFLFANISLMKINMALFICLRGHLCA